jgi:alkanesulfonate monooxygenase SsuD/methylene tetrahydromethanopterin reductase-like flavin-dependent oxidoreductase (luciferase family)
MPCGGGAALKFGVQFFPAVSPDVQSGEEYFSDALDVAEAADRLGYDTIRIVEHHFHWYGGYSPNPLLFLAAAAQRTKRARLVTGAVLPVFNNPLKLAGEIAMCDAISRGRLDVGFARAFLPHEFRKFGISLDESFARFMEGVEQIDLLLREENVTHHGRFHTIDGTTIFPRPTQKPRPKFYVAATNNPETFAFAGRNGYSVMGIPMIGEAVRETMRVYREAFRGSGAPGNGEVMLAFHMFVDEDGDRARRIAKPKIEKYLAAIAEASSDWLGTTSKDYTGYDKMVEKLRAETLESQIASGSAWIGTPAEVRDAIASRLADYGPFEHASLQVNFGGLPRDEALRSLELFAREVMPAFSEAPAEAAI